MSLNLMQLVLDRYEAATIGDKLLLVALARRAFDDGTSIRSSVPTMAAEVGVDPRSIRRMLTRLLESGVLVKVRESKGGWLKDTSHYSINVGLLTGDTEVTPVADDNPDPSVTPTPDPPVRGPLTHRSVTPDPSVTQQVLTGPREAKKKGASASPKRSAREIEAETFEAHLPSELDTPEFRDAWARLIAMRTDYRKVVWKPNTIIGHLTKAKAVGVERAIECIEDSINGCWAMLRFEPRRGRVGPKPRELCKPTDPAEHDWAARTRRIE